MSYLYVLVTLLGLLTTSSSNVIVWNSHLFDNGNEFYIRGVDYSPGIIGQDTVNFVTGYGGTGFCSAKLTPYNEYKSACYDSDYFDGKPWPQNTSINGFQPIWERDLPMIQSYGANLIRLYNCNPSTLAATQLYKNLFPFPNGKDHTLFMQRAAYYNLRVAFPLNMANADFPSLPTAEFIRYLRWQIDEVGGYPALLYWVMGNEQAWTWSTVDVATASVVAQYNAYVDYVKRYTYSKWGKWIPVSLSTHNSPYDAAELMPYVHLDFYSENFFSTVNSDYDWMMVNGISNNNKWFEGYKNLTCKYTKPFLITEYGRTYSVGQTYVQGSIPQILYNIYRYTTYGLLGGIYYEATDEPYAPNVNGVAYNYVFNNFGITSLAITPAANGQCNSNASNCFVPDTASIKSIQYNDLTAGTYNNVNYGYLQPVTTVLGRSLYTTSNVPDYCSPLGYKQCPNASPNTPMCSGNGMCNRITGTCSCGSGWGGSDCSVASCPNNCGGVGTCSSAVSPPECVCNSGYYGNACQNTLANRAANSCPGVNNCTYGNGVCNNVTFLCQCWPGWTGLDCAVTDLTYAGSTSSSSTVLSASASSIGATTSASVSSASSTSAATTASAVTTSVATTSSTSATTAGATTSAASVAVATSSSSSAVSTTASATTSAASASTSAASASTSAAKAASSATTTSASSTSGATTTTSASASTSSSTSSLVSSTSSTSGPSSSTIFASVVTSSLSSTSSATKATSSTSSTPSSSATAVSSTTGATTSSTAGPSSSISSSTSSASASSSTTGIRLSTTASATTSVTAATSSSSSASSSTSSTTTPTSTSSQSVSTTAQSVSATTSSTASTVSSTSATTGSVASTTTGAATTSSATEGSTSSTTGTQATTASSTAQASTSTSGAKATSTTSANSVSTSTVASSGSTTSTRASSSSSSATSSQASTTSITISKTTAVANTAQNLKAIYITVVVTVACFMF